MKKRKDTGTIDCDFEEEPAHCTSALAWLVARGWEIAPLTRQDLRAIEAVAHCWQLWGTADTDGRRAAIGAIAALVDGMQEVGWPMARELAAQALDWGHRGELWPQVCIAYECDQKGRYAVASLRHGGADPIQASKMFGRIHRMRDCYVNVPQVRQPDLSVVRGGP